jgi:hypothetical protein
VELPVWSRITVELLVSLHGFAWPLVVLVALFLLRKPLRGLIGNVAEVSLGHKGVSVKIREALEKATDTAESIEAERKVIAHAVEPAVTLEEVAEVAPDAAIIVAWSKYESILRDAAIKLEINPRLPAYQLTSQILLGPLGSETRRTVDRLTAVELSNDLQKIRNKVAHHLGKLNLSRADAVEFVENTLLLRDLVDEEVENRRNQATR